MIAVPPSTSEHRFGLRLQLNLALGLLSMLLIIVSGTALVSLAKIRDVTTQKTDADGRLNRLSNDIAIYTLLCRSYEKDMFLNLDDDIKQSYALLAWKGAYNSLDSAISAFSVYAVTEEDKQQVKQWRETSAKYQNAILQTEQAVTEGQITSIQGVNKALEPFQDAIQTLTTSALTVAQRKAVAAQQSIAELKQITETIRMVVLGTTAVALLVAVAWSLIFPIRLMRPISALQHAAVRLADGDVTARVALARKDELGLLGRTFDYMAMLVAQRTRDLETQNHQLQQSLHAQQQLLTTIQQLSAPLLPLMDGVVVLPVVGHVDTQRADAIMQTMLHGVAQRRARWAILDVTGIAVLDTHVSKLLLQTVQATQLLGAQVAIAGITATMAHVLVEQGVTLDHLRTYRDLHSAIEAVQMYEARHKGRQQFTTGGA